MNSDPSLYIFMCVKEKGERREERREKKEKNILKVVMNNI